MIDWWTFNVNYTAFEIKPAISNQASLKKKGSRKANKLKEKKGREDNKLKKKLKKKGGNILISVSLNGIRRYARNTNWTYMKLV